MLPTGQKYLFQELFILEWYVLHERYCTKSKFRQRISQILTFINVLEAQINNLYVQPTWACSSLSSRSTPSASLASDSLIARPWMMLFAYDRASKSSSRNCLYVSKQTKQQAYILKVSYVWNCYRKKQRWKKMEEYLPSFSRRPNKSASILDLLYNDKQLTWIIACSDTFFLIREGRVTISTVNITFRNFYI